MSQMRGTKARKGTQIGQKEGRNRKRSHIGASQRRQEEKREETRDRDRRCYIREAGNTLKLQEAEKKSEHQPPVSHLWGCKGLAAPGEKEDNVLGYPRCLK